MQHNIPAEIKTTFFEFLDCRITVTNFEQWVYKTFSLEEALNSDDYLELISLDFTQRNEKHYLDCCYQINNIIEKYIDFGEYETWKLERLLNDFLNRKSNLAIILGRFYYLYCHGHGFLDNLGLDYGYEFSNYYLEILSEEEIEQKVNDILPGVDKEIKKILFWLEQGKIKIIDDPYSYYGISYIDNRSESEKIPLYKIRQINH
jgi:hypothetical protein